jgi:hypothetical protein
VVKVHPTKREAAMTKKNDLTIGKTVGQEFEIPCTRCSGKTAHVVVASAELAGENDDVNWVDDYEVVRCGGCKTISFRKASSNSEDMVQVGYEEWDHAVYESVYPSRIEGRKGLGHDTRYLPPEVRRVYDETLVALVNQMPILSGIGLRALVEAVCKEKAAVGKDLLKKIDSLIQLGVLTARSAAILHKIRTLGNAAAHEVKPHTEKQLGVAMDIVEHLLRDVYILGKQVEAEFDD